MDARFGKREKLKSKTQIARLFSEGKSMNIFPLKLIFVPLENMEKTHKTGVSVPKRNFKRAVDRNKLKRLLRETFRQNKYLIGNTEKKYALMFIYTGKNMERYAQLFRLMEKILTRFVEREKQT